MSVRAKLTTLIVTVALVPLAMSAWMGLRVHQRAFRRQLDVLHRRMAEHGARLIALSLESTARNLETLVQKFDWPALAAEEQDGARWLVYGAHEDLAVVSLLDGSGEGVGASAYAPDRAAGHPGLGRALLERFARAIPFAEAQAAGSWVLGEPVHGDESAAPLVPLAFGVGKERSGAPWVVAVGLSLGSLCADLARSAAEGLEVLLVDREERLLCDGHGGSVPAELAALVERRPLGSAVELGSYHDASGRELEAALAGLPWGWTVVVQQPRSVAFASSRQMQEQTLYWILLSLVLALGAGLFLAGGITRALGELVRGAAEFRSSRFSYRLPIRSGDEFGQLSRAFNQMGEEVERRDRELLAWNAELQRRVEERTRELGEAQEQLLWSQKVAAVSALGAGFAHEINNPLTSVLAFTQILAARLGRGGARAEVELLSRIESEARRIQQIVATLLDLSNDYSGQDFAVIDANRLLDEAVEPLLAELEAHGIRLERRYAAGLPPLLGKASALREALTQICKNAITAMPEGGTLTLASGAVGGHALKLELGDTGVGIPSEHLGKIFDPFFTTKENWRGRGLGLTVAFQVVRQHHGRIQAHSQPGRGTTVTVTLPAGARESHLQ